MLTVSEELIKVRQENEANHYNLMAEKKLNAELLDALKRTVQAFRPQLKKMKIKTHFDEIHALACAEKVIYKAEVKDKQPGE